jgi:Lon protease-like protein
MSDTLPLFPLQTVLFPGMVLPLHIFEPRYRKMFAHRSESDPIFGVVLTRSGREVGEQPEIFEVGTGATLLSAIRHEDGRVDLAVRGGRRFRVLDGHWDEGYLVARVEWLPDDEAEASSPEATRLAKHVHIAFGAYLDALERTIDLRIERAQIGGEPASVAYTVCSAMPLAAAERQRLLEATPPLQLLEVVLEILSRERALLLATGIGGAANSRPGRFFSAN